MKRQYGIRLISVLLTLLILAACGGGADTPAWLMGRWQLSYNPNHDDSDVLVFLSGARVNIETVDGRTLEGHFQINQDQLLILIQARQREVETRFRISDTHDRLVYKNGAYYTKPVVTGQSDH